MDNCDFRQGEDQTAIFKILNFRRQSFSGLITQFNVWNASLEDFHVENMAECRSDAWGNAVAWKESLYTLGEEGSRVSYKTALSRFRVDIKWHLEATS